MKLVFRGHDERYVVEQSLMNLFPGELPVYEPITPGDDSWAVISLEETGDLCRVAVSLCRGGKTTEQTYQEPLSGGDFQREGLRRHAVGACFFLAARAVTGVTPPWGMLTGVRPDKPVTWALEDGNCPQMEYRFLCFLYHTIPDFNNRGHDPRLPIRSSRQHICDFRSCLLGLWYFRIDQLV